MTILLASISAEKCYVASDTGVLDRGTHKTISKLRVFTAMNCVTVGTGDGLFGENFYIEAMRVCGGFDNLLECFRPLVNDAYTQTLDFAVAAGWRDGLVQKFNSVMVAGWSEHQGRIIARMGMQHEPGGGFAIMDLARTVIQPRISGPHPETPEEMASFAQRQREWILQNHPQRWAPGKLQVATIDREAMSIRTIAELA